MSDLQLPTPVAILGTGVSGRAAYDLLRGEGVSADHLTFWDERSSERGVHTSSNELLKNFSPRSLVVSPGVPLSLDWIRAFEDSGGTVTSELELACARLKGEKILGVTGSLGKSTTVSLLGEAARVLDPHAFVGGNLGVPLSRYVCERDSGQRPQAQWIVLELSSFQLEKSRTLECVGCVLTSLARNHLERYPNLETYYATKWNLVRATQGPCVANLSGGDLKHYAQSQAEAVRVIWADRSHSTLSESDFQRAHLLGRHNQDNLAVAWALAEGLGWPKTCLAAMQKFSGLSHRLERVGEWRGVQCVNDSKATTMESVAVAVESVNPSGQLWLLLGGRDKGLPWEKLAVLKQRPHLKILFFGECAALAQKKSLLEGEIFPSLKVALEALPGQLKEGDLVLLSPGGSSLDEFKNFEQRGEYFAQRMKELLA